MLWPHLLWFSPLLTAAITQSFLLFFEQTKLFLFFWNTLPPRYRNAYLLSLSLGPNVTCSMMPDLTCYLKSQFVSLLQHSLLPPTLQQDLDPSLKQKLEELGSRTCSRGKEFHRSLVLYTSSRTTVLNSQSLKYSSKDKDHHVSKMFREKCLYLRSRQRLGLIVRFYQISFKID